MSLPFFCIHVNQVSMVQALIQTTWLALTCIKTWNYISCSRASENPGSQYLDSKTWTDPSLIIRIPVQVQFVCNPSLRHKASVHFTAFLDFFFLFSFFFFFFLGYNTEFFWFSGCLHLPRIGQNNQKWSCREVTIGFWTGSSQPKKQKGENNWRKISHGILCPFFHHFLNFCWAIPRACPVKGPSQPQQTHAHGLHKDRLAQPRPMQLSMWMHKHAAQACAMDGHHGAWWAAKSTMELAWPTGGISEFVSIYLHLLHDQVTKRTHAIRARIRQPGAFPGHDPTRFGPNQQRLYAMDGD